MVIDFAVVDDPDSLVLVRHGLVATGYVNDRQPSVSKTDRPLDQEPFAVGAAMAEYVAHPLEARLVDDLSWIQLDDAGNPAHRHYPRPTTTSWPPEHTRTRASPTPRPPRPAPSRRPRETPGADVGRRAERHTQVELRGS